MKTPVLQHAPLASLLGTDDFLSRHIGPSPQEQEHMLNFLGYDSLPQLLDDLLPHSIRTPGPLKMDPPRNEIQALAELQQRAQANTPLVCMYGCGYHPSHLPSALQRNVLENPNWYTAYTPYQAEISQGRLELILNFQQLVIELTGLPVAGASLLDEGTATAEAVRMAFAMSKTASKTVFVSAYLHPQTTAVLQTRCQPLGITIVPFTDQLPKGDAFAVVVQYPDTYGAIGTPNSIAEAARQRGIVPIAITDPLALMLITSPQSIGFAIAVGSSQRFGIPMGFGGPHAAYIACEEGLRRVLPGRLIGISKDRHGNRALRMALQTREQHIRREKATSNICTSQVLLANLAVLFAMHHGADGIQRIAQRVHRMARLLNHAAQTCGWDNTNTHYFDTLCFTSSKTKRDALAAQLLDQGLLVRNDDHGLSISCNELTSLEHLGTIVQAMGGQIPNWDAIDATLALTSQHASFERADKPLRHNIFHQYTNETTLTRYLTQLQAKDLTLTHSMIPLGSCTMKLNAACELQGISWPEFGNIHPFAPQHTTQGYLQLIAELEQMLCAVSGFAHASMQPNSGAQGEYAGLLAIRRYHQSRGETNRTICLIPSSAHGTNPASAVMAGMQVKVVACDAAGNIDIQDLKQKVATYGNDLAALMVTYPSTHGVYEESISELCDLVHDHGAMVYMDGANANALIGLIRPVDIGADVMHFNLHKTFCIPHGGGGPGVGPIGLTQALAPFAPGHPHPDDAPVSSAPYGSALILTISWVYMRLMGAQGLTQATQLALINANYIARKLAPHYPLLYTGRNHLVAHECIIDIRPIKASSGVTEEDIAKRLMDYGFHAPTMSFPVSGTLMIEPTESEGLAEIDRFCDAMIAIRHEIQAVEEGKWPKDNNPLCNAPHTNRLLCDNWELPYTQQQAFFPLPSIADNKFWPSVGRIDNVYGDRNLKCSCDDLSSYEST